MTTKTHWRKLRNPDYLGSWSIPDGEDLIVTILSVTNEMVKGSNGKEDGCTVAYLKDQKPMIVNAKNGTMIRNILESPFIEDWIGKSVQLYATQTKVAGEWVDCFRVRDFLPKQPEKRKFILKDDDKKNFDKLKKAVSEGHQINDILEKWDLTDNQIELLCKK